MIHRYRDGVPPDRADPLPFDTRAVDDAIEDFDLRKASGVVWAYVTEANRYANRTRPWAADPPARDVALSTLLATCRTLATELAPFLPATAAGIERRCTSAGGRLPIPEQLIESLDLATAGPSGVV